MARHLAVRHKIVLMALLINAVCYTDRVCIAVVEPEISKTFGFNRAEMGLVYSIFSLSYFLGRTGSARAGSSASHFAAGRSSRA